MRRKSSMRSPMGLPTMSSLAGLAARRATLLFIHSLRRRHPSPRSLLPSPPYPSAAPLLVGPQGQTVVLMADAGGGQPVSGLNITFDDNALTPLGEYTALTAGACRPGNLGSGDSFAAPAPGGPYGAGLYTFRGANPNGA